jgi:putative methyltransferase (TIGR04325 family)
MDIKRIIKWITPPILISAGKNIFFGGKRAFHEYEYIPQGWAISRTSNRIKGWNVQSILDTYKDKWPAFCGMVQSPSPFGISPEANGSEAFDLVFHNTLMVFAYSLALAARGKDQIKMLDWGGGIGHYYLLAKSFVPNLAIDYHCKDVPILADYGQRLFPEAHFYSDDSYTKERFDFILSSSSLQYAENWQSILAGFSACQNGYLLITRLPVTLANSYVFVQRPYQYGYNTEYLGWAISRAELLSCAAQAGLHLLREFVTGERPEIYGAPDPCEYRAYLFECDRQAR